MDGAQAKRLAGGLAPVTMNKLTLSLRWIRKRPDALHCQVMSPHTPQERTQNAVTLNERTNPPHWT